MGREIRSEMDRAPALFVAGNVPNNYAERFVKLIPSETIAFYIVFREIFRSGAGNANVRVMLASGFLFLLVLTPVYLKLVCHVKKNAQVVLTTLSFAFWVMALGDFGVIFTGMKLFQNYLLGASGLLSYTILVLFYYRGYDIKIDNRNNINYLREIMEKTENKQ
jgi:ACR3 family arsenite efflux pump ArsB